MNKPHVIMLESKERAKEGQIVRYKGDYVFATRQRFGNKFFDAENHGYNDVVPLHFIQLSNDKIEVGDWMYWWYTVAGFREKEVVRYTPNLIVTNLSKKIIAATDPSLNLPTVHNDIIEEYLKGWGGLIKDVE